MSAFPRSRREPSGVRLLPAARQPTMESLAMESLAIGHLNLPEDS